jgi:hypothetical protein
MIPKLKKYGYNYLEEDGDLVLSEDGEWIRREDIEKYLADFRKAVDNVEEKPFSWDELCGGLLDVIDTFLPRSEK